MNKLVMLREETHEFEDDPASGELRVTSPRLGSRDNSFAKLMRPACEAAHPLPCNIGTPFLPSNPFTLNVESLINSIPRQLLAMYVTEREWQFASNTKGDIS
jgi:hypothetical protein